MAILRAEVTFNLEPIQRLVKVFPELNGRFLALIGKRGRTRLKEAYLSGQELNLQKFPTDRKGKNTITSDVNRKRTQVKIYSYPVNLFETGRRLRSGVREPGKFIVTQKLKQDILSRLGTYASEFESKILTPEIKRTGL
jgi:hypothetical protein